MVEITLRDRTVFRTLLREKAYQSLYWKDIPLPHLLPCNFYSLPGIEARPAIFPLETPHT